MAAMMCEEMMRGCIVKAAAGRDKEKEGAFYAVIAAADGYILICDGKRRPLERPKRKNPRHIQKTDDIIPEEVMRTNKALRRALADYTARSSAV
ncbi:MAG: hypothetical protein E7559_09335 [Ruminococcaceae bacterium]|nr:hypothetical protein [Oscillospiraceae bacterium]